MCSRFLLRSACVALSAAPLFADQPSKPTELDLSNMAAMIMGGGSPPGADSEPALPDFAKVTKDMQSTKGLFTLWSYPPDAKDKDPEKLLCQIPANFLGEKFMLSTSISGGGFLTGFPLDQHVVQWELLGNQILLVEPETGYVIDGAETVKDVVRRTHPDRIRAAVPLVTKSPGGDPVIDFGGLLKSNFADIGWMSFGPMGMMGGGGGINPSLSKWNKKKTFELNVEIGVDLAVANPYPSGSYDKTLVHYSFWKLPQTDYTPRVADDRVGYFLTTNQDWGKPTDSRDIFNRYIDRWHLVKRDPSLPLCEPKQPIIFYIEKTVPVKFRRAVRDGILDWNKAYEKIGFVNAVEVRQQTDDNEWKDLDPEDMRYSFFRWIVTGAGFAMGPHRSNPFTGQIYDADIIFDDSMVRYFEQEAERMLSGAALLPTHDPVVEDFLERFPQWKRPTRDWERFVFDDHRETQRMDAIRKRMRERGQHLCDYSEGMKHQMAFAQTMLAGAPKEAVDRLLYDVVKEVVAHEVGHTLGLRHNFIASSIYSIDEIKRRKNTGEPTTGSVMDYNPTLFFADNPLEGHFVTPTIGPYDYWAIEYGYRPFDDSFKSESEKPESPGDSNNKDKAEPKKNEPARAVTKAAMTDISEIPKEALDQLPAEIRAAIASGNVAMAGGGKEPPCTPGKSDGPSFRAPSSGEEAMLKEIAARSMKPELAYATDEDTTFISPDPRVNRFDMGDNPVDWAKARIEMADKRMNNVLEWAVKDRESWYFLRQAFVSLLFEKAFVLDYVGRYAGGQYFNRSHRGDPDAKPPFTMIEPEKQRAALAFIEENMFSDKFFSFSPEVLNHLAPSRWWHEGTSISFTLDFPIHDVVAMLQWSNLFGRLFPNTLRRIHDAEMKSGAADKFTAAEYLQRMQKACWASATNARLAGSKAWTDGAPLLSSVQRSLQREYLGMMEPMVRQAPGTTLSPDLHAMAQHSLRQLANDLDEVIKTGKADFASQAHLVSCKSRIDRMLAPQLDEYSYRTAIMGGGME